jgi:dipeptidyl-peptidase-3
MGKLLVDLQVRKSTADAEGAKQFYEALTNPKPEWTGELRELVLFKKQVYTSLVQLACH